MIRVLERQGVTDTDRIDEILDELDNGDGKISISQYVSYMIRTQHEKNA